MSERDPQLKQFVMNRRHAKSLKGKVVDRIERDSSNVIRISFTDGTAVSFEFDTAGGQARLLAYFWLSGVKRQ